MTNEKSLETRTESGWKRTLSWLTVPGYSTYEWCKYFKGHSSEWDCLLMMAMDGIKASAYVQLANYLLQ